MVVYVEIFAGCIENDSTYLPSITSSKQSKFQGFLSDSQLPFDFYCRLWIDNSNHVHEPIVGELHLIRGKLTIDGNGTIVIDPSLCIVLSFPDTDCLIDPLPPSIWCTATVTNKNQSKTSIQMKSSTFASNIQSSITLECCYFPKRYSKFIVSLRDSTDLLIQGSISSIDQFKIIVYNTEFNYISTSKNPSDQSKLTTFPFGKSINYTYFRKKDYC